MHRDEGLHLEVDNELKSERKISNPDRIEVSVKDGIVTLGGYVDHYIDRVAAQMAAERVSGIAGVVQDITVELPAGSKRVDREIAGSACSAIELNSILPSDRITVVVSDGMVTLEGRVNELHQKEEAEIVVSRILGVKGVSNSIEVVQEVRPSDVTLEIVRTFSIWQCSMSKTSMSKWMMAR